MFIINIILWILKIIGITVLAILGLILLILCLLLFVPIRYDIKAQYKNSFNVAAHITYLLKAVRVTYSMTGSDSRTDIKILCFAVSGHNDKPKHKKRHKKDVTENNIADEIAGKKATEENTTEVKATEVLIKPNTDEPVIKEEANMAEEPDCSKESETHDVSDNTLNSYVKEDRQLINKKKKTEKNNKKNKNVHTKSDFGGIMDNAKSVVNMIKENRSVISYLIRQLKSLFHHILPGSHVINLRIGLDDPATLGEIIGAVAVIRAMTNLVINITPVWDDKVIEAECRFRGRILLGKILFIALRVYFNRDVKRIINVLKK